MTTDPTSPDAVSTSTPPITMHPLASTGVTTVGDTDSDFASLTFRDLATRIFPCHFEDSKMSDRDEDATFADFVAYLPDGFEVARTVDQPGTKSKILLAVRGVGDALDAAVLLRTWGGGRMYVVEVAAFDPDTAASIGRSIVEAVPPRTPEDAAVQYIRSWYLGNGDIDSTSKRVVTEDWDEIRANYPASMHAELDALMAYRPTEADEARSGRIVLLHGAPGTGKTSVVRALARSWFDWCQPELLVDAENVFSEANYLMQVLGRSAARNGEAREDLWRLLIAEDADLYLREAAGANLNPALDRLLNVGDGLLAQGQKILVVLTTNTKIAQLPQALTRPGRCLSIHEFLPFQAGEARAWLGEDAAGVTSQLTLAELYEKKGASSRIAAPKPIDLPGTYL